MRPISGKDKAIIDERKYFKTCVRHADGGCGGRITIEHALIFAGKQIAELWNYVPLCEYHHGVNSYQDRGDLKKDINVMFALMQATDSQLRQYSKAIDYIAKRAILFNQYGKHYFPGKLLQEAHRDVLSKIGL